MTTIRDLSNDLHISEQTGIDWPRVVRGLLYENTDPRRAYSLDGNVRGYVLGSVSELVPSGASYNTWDVGDIVSVDQARADAEYMQALRNEAAAAGLTIWVSPCGEVAVNATVVPAISLPDGALATMPGAERL